MWNPSIPLEIKARFPKGHASTKGKSPKSSGKSSVNGAGKLKSGLSKVKEIKDKEHSADLNEQQENTKGKSVSSSKC